jgi:hypothetical protein
MREPVLSDHVNFWYLFATFGVFISSSRESGWRTLDANSEIAMKEAYRKFIIPWERQLRPVNRQVLKRTLAHFLNKEFDFDDNVLSNLQDIDMTEPRDARALFVWLWEVLYPRECFSAVDTSNAREENEVMLLNAFE